MSELTRTLAYTTPRPDVSGMVPSTAKMILDVGCSNGALGASLRSMVSGRQITGIDADPAMCREASTKLDRVITVDLDQFQWADVFPEAIFDCIIFADVLEHLRDPLGHLKQAQCCLRPGGSLVISLPNIRHLSAAYSIFARGTFPRRDRGIFDRTHLRWFTFRDAKKLVCDAGFRMEAITTSIRLGDRGDGFLNRVARKLLSPVENIPPVREFLGYQFCFRAVRAEAKTAA
jgi:2-polyprenyl-3-methyl-5-hydroxy-6-metoxy-1,4-benzoquinol methylase